MIAEPSSKKGKATASENSSLLVHSSQRNYGSLRTPQETKSDHFELKERSFLTRTFELDTRKTTVWREIRAGITTFLTMAFILVVNPQIMGEPHTSLTRSDVVLATAIATAVSSFLLGIFGNLPFGCAPGLGLSAYLSYGIIAGDGLGTAHGLALCCFSGFVMLLLSVFGISEYLMNLIPKTIRVATIVGMGLLLAFIALQEVHFVVQGSSEEGMVKLGSLINPFPWITLFGLMLVATLTFYQVRGAVLAGILCITFFIWTISSIEHVKASDDDARAVFNKPWPTRVMSSPDFSQVSDIFSAAFNWKSLFRDVSLKKIIPAVLAFIAVAVFDVSGVMFGCARLANLYDKEKDSVPGSKWAFLATALGTCLAAALGCSPIIVHIESIAGIKDGGRTGLTAVTVAFLFMISVFFVPVLAEIPKAATAPAMLLIGAMMMGSAKEIDWECMFQAVPAFLTIIIMPFTFSIPNGIFFGTLAHIVLYLTAGAWIKSEPGTIVDNESLSSSLQSNKNQRHHSHSLLQNDRYERTPSFLLREKSSENELHRYIDEKEELDIKDIM